MAEPEILIRDTEPGDAELLAPTLREADRRELAATAPGDAVDLIRASIAISPRFCKTVFGTERQIVLIFGVGSLSLLGSRGSPWLLGTDDIKRHQELFVDLCRDHFPTMQRGFRCFENWVHGENKGSQSWLRWLGFTLEAPAPYGHRGELFRRFHMEF